MTARVRTAVVGAGYFGRFHALHHAANPDIDLVAVVDTDRGRAETVANEANTQALTDYSELTGRIDAASVTVPTSHHFNVAHDLLDAGIHVLVEKPITSECADAASLIKLANERELILAVGHIERYSAPYLALREKVHSPRYIESHRISPWKPRAIDVDVVLDLMIHDIDIILGLVGAPVTRVDAVGASVINPTEDIANARITFASGCVATVTASRISHKTQRVMRVFQPDGYIVCDYADSRIVHFQRKAGSPADDLNAITVDTQEITKHDALQREIAEFARCVTSGHASTVDGTAGLKALEITNMIKDSLRAQSAACIQYLQTNEIAEKCA